MLLISHNRSRTNSISFKTIRRKKAPLQASIFTRPVANDFSQAYVSGENTREKRGRGRGEGRGEINRII